VFSRFQHTLPKLQVGTAWECHVMTTASKRIPIWIDGLSLQMKALESFETSVTIWPPPQRIMAAGWIHCCSLNTCNIALGPCVCDGVSCIQSVCEEFRTSDNNYEHNTNILSSKGYLTTQLVPDYGLDIGVWLQRGSNISSFDHQLRVKPGFDTFPRDKDG
jgi:hypothetical protein